MQKHAQLLYQACQGQEVSQGRSLDSSAAGKH